MHPKLAAPYKTLLVAQRISLLEQRANLRGGAVGSYGVCIDCGTDIPAARLYATPEAERCIACQQITE